MGRKWIKNQAYAVPCTGPDTQILIQRLKQSTGCTLIAIFFLLNNPFSCMWISEKRGFDKQKWASFSLLKQYFYFSSLTRCRRCKWYLFLLNMEPSYWVYQKCFDILVYILETIWICRGFKNLFYCTFPPLNKRYVYPL